LDLLQKLPEGPERIRREVLLQLIVGAAFIIVKGYAAPEAERAYTRARELCQRLGNPPLPALSGLWIMHSLRGELPRAYELAERSLRLAQEARDPTLLGHAQHGLGSTSFWMGRFLAAMEHLENAIALYAPERNLLPVPLIGLMADARVRTLCYTALTLWLLGYPDQALKRGNESLALAQRLSHPLSLTFAQYLAGCVLHLLRREVHASS
jgi:tetratricopeptide (TPR) repeat protein